MQKEKTLASEYSLKGKGLHTGRNVNITFKPDPENHGDKINRTDIEDKPDMNA